LIVARGTGSTCCTFTTLEFDDIADLKRLLTECADFYVKVV